MKVWTVTYTARRKREVYESQDVTVTFTQAQYEETFGRMPPVMDPMEIEQLAVEKGEAVLDDTAWTVTASSEEPLDAIEFEVNERETQKYTVRLSKTVMDALEAFVEVEATDEDSAAEAAIAKVDKADWEFYASVSDGDDRHIEVVSVWKEGTTI